MKSNPSCLILLFLNFALILIKNYRFFPVLPLIRYYQPYLYVSQRRPTKVMKSEASQNKLAHIVSYHALYLYAVFIFIIVILAHFKQFYGPANLDSAVVPGQKKKRTTSTTMTTKTTVKLFDKVCFHPRHQEIKLESTNAQQPRTLCKCRTKRAKANFGPYWVEAWVVAGGGGKTFFIILP